MTVVSTHKDTESLALTLVAELAAPPERVWELWADPRRLEKWWGPPTWPATFTRYEPVPGGEARYHMTGPDGEKVGGWWRFVAVDEPHSLEVEDGFAGPDGEPDDAMPAIRMHAVMEPIPTGTRMTVRSSFASAEQMEQVVQMGMVEGMTEAMNQMDALLTA